jgi:hypothetical protein
MADETAETRLDDGEGLRIAQPEDFGIQRDDEGDLKPIKQAIPGSDGKAIRCLPVVDVEPVVDVLEGIGGSLPDDRVDEVAEQYIVEGPGADGDLSEYPDYAATAILQALKDASGHQYFRAAQERRLEEEAALIESIGPETLQRLNQVGQTDNGQPP